MDIVHDEPEVTGPDEELSPGEKRAFAALPRELEPPASLEDRTALMLRQHGQLPIPLVSRRQDARTPRTKWIAAGAIAAALAIFTSGIAVGQYLGMTGAVNLAQLTAQSSATQAAAHVRHAGDMYVAALASLNNLRDTTDVQGREQARKFALAALGAAAEEVAHIAPDDPLAAAVLRGLNQRTRVGGGVGVGVRRGWFGIQLEENVIQRGPGRVAYVQRPAINWVESGSPAYQAGLRNGDTLVSINGLAFTTPEGFEAFATAVPGTAVRLVVRKAGQEREVSVTPMDNSTSVTTQDFYMQRLRTAQRLGLTALRNAFRSPLGWLGMGLECEQCSVTNFGQRMRSASFRQPPAVLTVDVDGPAHRAGLRRGDTLTTIDGVDLTSREGGRAFADVEPGQRVTLGVRRGGAERRVVLVAVARPDATAEEIAAFDEYKRSRDSSDASYREILAASTARAQLSIRELERALREMDNSRSAADSTRRVMGSLDSIMRLLRQLERRKYNESGFDFSFAAPNINVAPRAYAGPVPPTPAMAPMAPMATTMSGMAASFPLRYSGRLGTVNIEGRGYGPINATEVSDSLIVINTGTAEIKVYVRPNR